MDDGAALKKGLSVQGIGFRFPETQILKDVSFSIVPGTLTALIGLNGAGKTTLLRCLTGFLKISSGRILWDGRVVGDYSRGDLARKVGFAETNGVPFFPCTVGEMILFGRSPHVGFFGSFSGEDREIAGGLAEAMGLSGLLDRPFDAISAGERQRARLAMALAARPEYLLLDEPTSHLDPFFQVACLRFLRAQARERGLAVLAVLHDVNFARLFDSILVLQDGKISFADSSARIMRQEVLDQIYGKGVFRSQGSGRDAFCILCEL